jgi:Uma2 family endonuclease
METVSTLITADELLRMPETNSRLELVRGELVERPFASWAAAHAAAELCRALADVVEARDLGETFLPVGYHLWSDPDTVRAPSVSFVARETMQQVREEVPGDRYIPGAPDIAVEITSVWDTYDLMMGKVHDWLEAGTRLVWLVSPGRRSVSVFRSLKDIAVLTEDDVLDGGDVLPGFGLPVREIFA